MVTKRHSLMSNNSEEKNQSDEYESNDSEDSLKL